jgi:O-antigen/teichoic acid export membrane protein
VETGDSSSREGEVFWRSRDWWRRAGHTTLGVWAASGLSILGTIVAARALGPEEYGSVVLALAVVTSVATFLDITFDEATVFYGNRALASGDFAGLRALLRISLKVDIAIGIVVTAAILAASAPLADFASAGRIDPILVQLSALTVLVTTADGTAHAVLGLARRTDLRARGMAAQAAFRLIAIFIAVQLGGAEAFVAAYAAGSAAGSAVLGLMAWRVGWSRWDPGTRSGAPPASASQLVRFAIHSSLTTSVQTVSGTIVPVILGRAVGPAAVGIFRVARLPMVVVRTVGGPMQVAMFPEQAKFFADGRVDEIRRSTRAYTLIAFGLGSVGGGIAYVLMPWLIPLLYSSSFNSAVTPARILLIGALFNFALSWRKSLLAAIGRPEIRTRLAIVQLTVTLTVLLVLADMGADGAAIAVSAGCVSAGVAWLIIARGLLTRESLIESRERHLQPVAEAPS